MNNFDWFRVKEKKKKKQKRREGGGENKGGRRGREMSAYDYEMNFESFLFLQPGMSEFFNTLLE